MTVSPGPKPGRTIATLFRASDGDCILFRCLDGSDSFNILIDAGRSSTVKKLNNFIKNLPEPERKIDLFVVTHIDADHIAGAIALGKDDHLKAMVRSVWFNGAQHLSEGDSIPLSTDQGDAFTDLITSNDWAWNEATGGKAIVRRPASDPILVCEKPRIELQILGPLPSGLVALAKNWPLAEQPQENEEIFGAKRMGTEAGPPDVESLAAAEYSPDDTIPNGSSIALLLRHGEQRILICGNSHAETIVDAVENLLGGQLKVDMATLPHHGSRRNTSPDLADRVSASTWTVSTEGGGQHLFPHGEPIAQILRHKTHNQHVRFIFNSIHAEASLWNDLQTMAIHGYSVDYRSENDDWITFEVGG